MSGEAEKVIPQELGPAPPASSTDVGETSKTANVSSVANGDADNKAVGGNDKDDQITPAVASAVPAESPISAPSLTASAPASSSLAGPETSKEIPTSTVTKASDQPKAASAEPSTSPTVALADKGTKGITEHVGPTSQKTAEAVTPDVSVKPTEVAAEKVDHEKVGHGAKNNVAAYTPVVSANRTIRDDDIEMGEAHTAPDDTAAAKAVEEAPSLGGGKRKADEAFGDSNSDLGDAQAKPEVNTANVVNGNDIPTKKSGPGHPKKQQKAHKILTPVGRTARKTRSQGPV